MAAQESVGLPGTRSEPPPYVLGERGAPLEAPENTLAGLRRALEVGADGVACDVRATADDELILLADEDLDTAVVRLLEAVGFRAGVRSV